MKSIKHPWLFCLLMHPAFFGFASLLKAAPPATPANITVTNLHAAVQLDWDANAEPDFKQYKVYRSATVGGTYAYRGYGSDDTRYRDCEMSNGSTWYYKVSAVNLAGEESPLSDAIVVQPVANPLIPIPELDGGWWQIAENAPDVSPYNNHPHHNACDFTIFQAADGTWQLIACIRETTISCATRLFYRWEGQNLTDTFWTGQGIFLTCMDVGTASSTQAPHCFFESGLHYFFFNSTGARCWTSADGKNFSMHTDYLGNSKFFDMGRDVMVFDNRARDGLWHAYYTANAMEKRTATQLEGPWSDPPVTVLSGDNPESPFVVRYGNGYYLWAQSSVYYSVDPAHFQSPPVTVMWRGKYAPEILKSNGQYYAAGYGNGIHLARLAWHVPDDSLTIATTTLPNAGWGLPYSQILEAIGGSTPYLWSITAGVLPAGLSLNASTGEIAGTPAVGGTFAFTVQVSDSSQPAQTDTRALSLEVLSPPAAPNDLTALASSATRIALAWNDQSNDESGFLVQRSADGLLGWTEIAQTGANITTYSDIGLAAGQTFYYRVASWSSGGVSAWSGVSGATTASSDGSGPAVGHVSTDEATGADWRSTGVAKPDDVDSDSAYGTDGYKMFSVEKVSLPSYIASVVDGPNIFRVATGGGAFDDPALPLAPAVADYTAGKLDLNIADGLEGVFVRITLAADKNFCRLGVITGHKSNEMCASLRLEMAGTGSSTAQIPCSNTIKQHHLFDFHGSAGDTFVLYGTTRTNGQNRNSIVGIFFDSGNGVSQPLPEAPAGLIAGPVSDQQIDLTWTDLSIGESGFQIERSPDGQSAWTTIGSTPANVTSFVDQGLQAQTIYYYRVWSYNPSGRSTTAAGAHAATRATNRSWGLGMAVVSSNVQISFASDPGQTYRLYRNVHTPDPNDARWEWAGQITGDGQSQAFTSTLPEHGAVFYFIRRGDP